MIPKPSVDRLAEIGKWMKRNGDAIYGTAASPYPRPFKWGRITQKPGKLYLLVYGWRKKLVLRGLRNKVKSAWLLAGRQAKVAFDDAHDRAEDTHKLTLSLPAKRPDRHVSVVVVEFAGKLDVDDTAEQ